MSKPRDDRQKDLLLPTLDQIIDMAHPLVRLAALIDWKFLDDRFGSVCQTGPGQPGLPTRLVAGLFILKHMHNLSDEVLCARWIENPYYQQGLDLGAGPPRHAFIRREMKRRAAVEPVIGHVKAEHRMDRNYLKGRVGDRINAVLAAAGYNFGLLLRWLAELLRTIIRALAETVPAQKIA